MTPQKIKQLLKSVDANMTRLYFKGEQWNHPLWGHFKPIVDFKIQKDSFVLIGGKIPYTFYTPTMFLYFLIHHLRYEMDVDKLDESHIVKRWFESLKIKTENRYTEENKDAVFSDVINLGRLAFDVYVVQHHKIKVQDLTKRLKKSDLFQGKRYEILIATFFLQAGFSVKWVPETSESKTVEFVATHPITKNVFSVECKAKNRAGENDLKKGIGGLLNSAEIKDPSHPYFIFVDANLPQAEFLKIVYSNNYSVGRTTSGHSIYLIITNFLDNYNDTWIKERVSHTSPTFKSTYDDKTSYEFFLLQNCIRLYPGIPMFNYIIGEGKFEKIDPEKI